MKKIIGLLIAVAVLCVLAYGYFVLGKKAAVETSHYMEDSKAQIDNAKKSFEDVEKNQEETKKAIESIGR